MVTSAALERRMANAHLIGLIPEMMAQLMSVEAHLEEYIRITRLSNNGKPDRTLALLKDVKGVLAKAEGWT